MASITKRDGKWFAQVRKHGHSSSRTFTQKRDAETWAKQLEIELERQDLPQNPKEKLKGTLGQLVERYKTEVCPRKKGCQNEQWALGAFLKHKICKKLVHEVTVTDFASYRNERLKKVKPQTLHREFTILGNMFVVAKDEWGLPLKINPVAELGFKAKVVRRERRIDGNEIDAIVQEAKRRKNPLILLVFLLALETGCRRSELLNMLWRHLDIRARTLTIPDSKNGDKRTIPLTKRAIEILESLDITEDRVFPINPRTYKSTWHRIMNAVDLSDLRFHDTRHECISSLFDRDLHIGEVKSISGHKTLSQLSTYVNSRHKDIIRKLDASEACHA